MKNTIFILSITILLFSCKKEDNNTNTTTPTFKYVKTILDSASNRIDSLAYINNELSVQTNRNLTTGIVGITKNYTKSGNTINYYYGAINPLYLANIITTNANGYVQQDNYVFGGAIEPNVYYTYDSEGRLLYSRNSNTIRVVYDTLVWSGKNLMSQKKHFAYNNGDNSYYTSTFTYNLIKKNNLLNENLGKKYLGFNNSFACENICTGLARITLEYTAGNPIPVITNDNYTYEHIFDASNLIITQRYSKNGVVYGRTDYTYY